MAAIALPQFKLPAVDVLGVLRNPMTGLVAATALFAGAAVALLNLAGPSRGPDHVYLPLEETLRHAPPGWREALKPMYGKAQTLSGLIQLSERPLAPGATPGAMAQRGPASFAGGPLAPAPIAGFYAPGPAGPLPIIAQDGRTPAEAYARPFRPNGRPKVALVVDGLGLDERRTREAIETLRPEVTLSFSIYAKGLQGWIDMARAHGHEVLIAAPMEPVDFPDNDPGPSALMADSQPPETVKKLEWVLSRASGYFGVTHYLGSRFLGSDAAYGAFASSLRGRGLAFIDDGTAARRGGGVIRATAERVIDDNPSGASIDAQLAAMESSALQHGQALGWGFAYPITLQKVAAWTAEVEARGYQLAPASALTRKR